MLSDLHPPRLPEDFAAPGWPEALAALALGLLLALLVFALLRPVLHRKQRRFLPDLRALPPEDRLLAELRLLRDLGGKVPEGVDLYAGPPPDLSAQVGKAWRDA